MHRRNVLYVVARNQVSIHQLSLEHGFAVQHYLAHHAVMTQHEADTPGSNREAPSRAQFLARRLAVAEAAQHEPTRTHTGATGDANFADGERSDRTLGRVSDVDYRVGWNRGMHGARNQRVSRV